MDLVINKDTIDVLKGEHGIDGVALSGQFLSEEFTKDLKTLNNDTTPPVYEDDQFYIDRKQEILDLIENGQAKYDEFMGIIAKSVNKHDSVFANELGFLKQIYHRTGKCPTGLLFVMSDFLNDQGDTKITIEKMAICYKSSQGL